MKLQFNSTIGKLAAVITLLVVIIVLYSFFGKKKETLQDIQGTELPKPVVMLPDASVIPSKEYEQVTDESYTRLLPTYDSSSEFAKNNPITSLLKEQNYILGGYPIGINTVSQANKMPYLDIRELPVIPKEDVSPWNNSPYDQTSGQNRRGLKLN